MPVLSKIALPAKLENLPAFLTVVSRSARAQGLSENKIKAIELASEEVLVNIFHYAFREKEGDVEIICQTDRKERLMIEIMDTGIPFDPLSKEEPDLTQDITTRKIGGLGIHIVKAFMDQVHYRREDDKNILTLVIS